jgi:predicted nuclease of restriction endonuclease-like (RecB) superfamily
LTKISDIPEAYYYIKASSEFGWSRNVLLNQIKSDAYHRALSENKLHNFQRALPAYLAEQAEFCRKIEKCFLIMFLKN